MDAQDMRVEGITENDTQVRIRWMDDPLWLPLMGAAERCLGQAEPSTYI